MDIGGPYPKGLPVTDREVTEDLWPRYLLVGSLVPFQQKDAKEHYEQ